MDAVASKLAHRPLTDGEVAVHEDHLVLGPRSLAFHHVWLRDNCGCSKCRVELSGERGLFTAAIADDIAPLCAKTSPDGRHLEIDWNDGHSSRFSLAWLSDHDYSASAPTRTRPAPILWDRGLGRPPTFDHDAVLGTAEGQLAYLEAVRDYGVAVVRGTPSQDREVERFAQAIGHVRETAFERVHNIRHDPSGYNVAHTPVELKAHTDLPSYHWPPSIQLLHFVLNEAVGGESTVTDGWAVLADLRREDPGAFDLLARVPVTFQLFSADEDTYATAPMIQLDSFGEVATFRFSNQLAQPIAARFEDVGAFYAAYRKLGRMIDSDRYKVAFRAETGDLITVHGHRVMHGRLSFDPTSGGRHLQDVYMEYDDLMARRRVLSGTHIPGSSTGGEPMSEAVVSFTQMKDGTKEDYELLGRLEAEELKDFPARVLGWLDTMEDSAGYRVSRREHCLQAATRALRAGEDEETVVCALLHDIGDYLSPANHSEAAAAVLRPYLSEKNYWILKHHGAFQGVYYLHHLGLDPHVRDRWRDHPHYQATVDFCENYDQCSFDPDYDSEPLSFFEPMVRRLLGCVPEAAL